MSVESAADLASLFNAGEFGAAATWSRLDGLVAEVTVILDQPTEQLDMGSGEVITTGLVAVLIAAEVPGIAAGDGLVIGASAYVVRQVMANADPTGRLLRVQLRAT